MPFTPQKLAQSSACHLSTRGLLLPHWKQISCKVEHTSQEKTHRCRQFFSSDENWPGSRKTNDQGQQQEKISSAVMNSHTPQVKESLQGHLNIINALFPFSKLEKPRQGKRSSHAAVQQDLGSSISVLLTALLLLAFPSIRSRSKAAQVLTLCKSSIDYV